MNAKVCDLMTSTAITTQPHKSVSHIRKMMEKNRIGSVPVVDTEGRPIGIVSAIDLVPELKADSPIRTIMTEKVYTIPKYEKVAIAARVMRNHKIHHLVVTHEKTVVGVLSAFDLLQLVENHNYVAKNPPTQSSRRVTKRL